MRILKAGFEHYFPVARGSGKCGRVFPWKPWFYRGIILVASVRTDSHPSPGLHLAAAGRELRLRPTRDLRPGPGGSAAGAPERGTFCREKALGVPTFEQLFRGSTSGFPGFHRLRRFFWGTPLGFPEVPTVVRVLLGDAPQVFSGWARVFPPEMFPCKRVVLGQNLASRVGYGSKLGGRPCVSTSTRELRVEFGLPVLERQSYRKG